VRVSGRRETSISLIYILSDLWKLVKTYAKVCTDFAGKIVPVSRPAPESSLALIYEEFLSQIY